MIKKDEIKNEENNSNVLVFKRKTIFILLLMISIVTLGISYALFSETLFGKKLYTLESNGLKIYLDESQTENNIVLQNTVPVSDDTGLANTPYIFSLANNEKEALDYTIYLKEEEYDNKTPSSAIRYQYTRDIDNLYIIRNIEDQKTEDGRYYLETGIIPPNNTYRYEFRMWINLDAGNEILNTKYSVHLEVEATQTTRIYQEEILNGTDPILSENLVPVMIAADGTVKKASLYEKWYSYTEKKWANAVVLEDGAKVYNAGEVIPEDKIESYFVWIPRYKYKIFNDGNYTGTTSLNPDAPQPIEIEFESKEASTSNGTAKDEWLSHPAFQAFNSNGFWVGKFESGYRGATTTTAAEVNVADSSKLIIKPNVYSWRGNMIGNMFKASYGYLRDNESHMMKNTEWGAVAYLSHSNYGVNKEVYINNNSAYLTGCGGDAESEGAIDICSNAYGSKGSNVYSQTTTGNISGVFDMSGGALEFVMGYVTNASNVGGDSGITDLYFDFFTNSRWDRYYDKYTGDSQTSYNYRILGDATGEMGPFDTVLGGHRSSWYGDTAYFAIPSGPWIHRGGNYHLALDSGIFYFSYGAGGSAGNTGASFRVVMMP